MDDRASSHEQNRLVKNVGEGMGRGTVQRNGRAHAHARHHVAHLTDDVISQKPSDVIGQHRVDHAPKRHDRSKHHQKFGSRKPPDQGVDRGLGGECAKKNGSGDRGFWVGVGEPCMEGGHGRIDQKADQDQVKAWA